MRNRDQRDNDILNQCICKDSSGEIHQGEQEIARIEGEERCLRRAMWLVGLLSALSLLGRGYSAVLLHRWPPSQTRIIDHILIVVALASFLSLLWFGGMWLLKRRQLTTHRETVRRVVMRLLAQPRAADQPPKDSRAKVA
jgi:hypothetical protein